MSLLVVNNSQKSRQKWAHGGLVAGPYLYLDHLRYAYKPTILYLVLCCDDSLYIGMTYDLAHRLRQHREGTGSTYVRKHGFQECLATRMFPNRWQASAAEYFFKDKIEGHTSSEFQSDLLRTILDSFDLFRDG